MDESEAVRRLLSGTSTPEEREALEKLLAINDRVERAKATELFLQGLTQVHQALLDEVRDLAMERERIRQIRHVDAGLLVIKGMAIAALALLVFLIGRMVFQ